MKHQRQKKLIQSVFIILPSEDNACIFYGQIDQKDVIDDLGNILGVIVEYANRLENSQVKSIRISQGKFVYGKFDMIYVIFKIQQSDELDDVKANLENMAKGFISMYKDKLDSNNSDASTYEKFSEKINSFIEKPKEKIETIKPKLESKEPSSDKTEPMLEKQTNKEPIRKSGSEMLKTPKPIEYTPKELPKTEELNGKNPIIQPEKRDAFPNGIDEYMVDEVLWNESQAVSKDYTADFVDGIIAKIQVFLSISIVHHYEIIIDFQNYPDKPTFEPTSSMTESIIEMVLNASYFMKNWDPKMPPHIVEIVREIEKILSLLKTQNKLEPNAELPESMVPDLLPIEKLPPLPESEKPKIKPIPEPTEQKTNTLKNMSLSSVVDNVNEEDLETEPTDKPESKTQESKDVQVKPLSQGDKEKENEKLQKKLEKEQKEKEKQMEKEKKQKEKDQKKQIKDDKKSEKKELQGFIKEIKEDTD